MVAIRRLSFVAALVVCVSGCIAQSAPTPVPVRTRTAAPATPATAAPVATRTPQPDTTPAPSVRPTTGFFFLPAEIVAYYEYGVGFACEPWQAAAAPGHEVRACRLADATNPPGDQVLTLTVDGAGDLADILAGYVHRDGSTVDRDAAMRFFATVLGASFGGDDGAVAATWLTGNLGAPSASLDLRGLRFGTFLPDLPEDRGSSLFIEIATPAFTAAAG